jgi:hypothetical protein
MPLLGIRLFPPPLEEKVLVGRFALDLEVMRENLPVFPHRRFGFAEAAASFPAVWIC